MKKQFPLYRGGFVANYLVTEPMTEPFEAPYALKDQLQFEHEMRGIYYVKPEGDPTPARLGEVSPLGTPWKYYTQNRNVYVDYSTFYFSLTRVTFLVNTTLVSDKKRSVKARVWSYAAYDMWLRGEHVLTEKVPVYQPINYRDLTLELNEGENDVYFHVQNFGVRDTRNMIALEIYDTDGITVTLNADEDTLAELGAAEEWFFGLRAEGDELIAPFKPSFDVSVKSGGKDSVNTGSWDKYTLGNEFLTEVSATVAGQKFSRTIERFAKKLPPYRKRGNVDPFVDNRENVLEECNYMNRTSADLYGEQGHGASSITQCYFDNIGCKADERVCTDIIEALKYVDKRLDCSDFVLSVVLRIAKTAELPEKTYNEIKKSALAFRYWMDENGADAMCFWSENHALTFYICQLMAGELFPDDVFMRSERTGREQVEVAKRRIREWFDVIEAEGFEEFCAGGYMGVTIGALVGVYDFAGEEFKPRAAAMLDEIAKQSAIQCFAGVHMAPMGRIYRGSITPYVSSVQALLYLLSDKNAHYSFGRFTNLSTTEYKLPAGLDELMFGDVDTVFESGRAEIHTKKTGNYMLTSVASPRDFVPDKGLDETTEYYKTKIMNESFHGTSLFTPGGNGYQQHLWYAAISDRFYTFVNLPGTERDYCGMRPGYWFGNLIFPAIKQIGRELWCHYDIPDGVPTKFTHAYYPAYAADECLEKDGWRFARVGDSYLALWCSAELEMWCADAVAEADLRAYGDRMAWYVKVGSRGEDGSFDAFCNACLESDVSYDKAVSVLKI